MTKSDTHLKLKIISLSLPPFSKHFLEYSKPISIIDVITFVDVCVYVCVYMNACEDVCM